jgi:hypothetical protein
MVELEPVEPVLPVALADGDSLRYYPAFGVPERRYLPAPEPVVERLSVQLLVVPRPDGRLTIGDTHVDDPSAEIGSDEEADEYLLWRTTELLARASGFADAGPARTDAGRTAAAPC